MSSYIRLAHGLVIAAALVACASDDSGPVVRAGSGGSGSSTTGASGTGTGQGSTSTTGAGQSSTTAATSSTGQGSSAATSGTGGSTGSSTTAGTSGGAGGASSTGGTAGSGGSTGVGGAAGAGTGGAGMGGGPGSLVDPTCLDGKVYAAEPIAAMRADISDLMSSFNLANRLSWSVQVLTRRYPNGAAILTGATQGANSPNGESNCFGIAYGAGDTTAQKTVAGFRTAVHECGHMMDLNHQRFMMRTMPDPLEYDCKIDLPSGTPARSIILKDEFDALGPTGGNLDFQKMVYLQPTGNPGSGGDENFPYLFTEFSQYVNTIATSFAVYDVAPDDSIAGDASRDFAWFVERYLRLLRASYASEYNKLTADTCWRQLMLGVWGRANRYWVESTKAGATKLVSDEAAKVDKLIQDPKLLAEIENLRVLDGCRK